MKATGSTSTVRNQRQELSHLYRRVRGATESICAPLAYEDCVVQSMPEASPTKWHLAHTSWFFETFVLRPHAPDYEMLEPRYEFLFNSYYNAVGVQFPRLQRGMLSRPTLEEVRAYRRHVDQGMAGFMEAAPERVLGIAAAVIELGLNHEEQHQELILTDLKHVLGSNPLAPAYRREAARSPRQGKSAGARWVDHAGGIVAIGHEETGFAFDNERPRHETLLRPFAIADRLVTCGEYVAFMQDGGYDRVELWLSDGWEACRRLGWKSPLYWQETESGWDHYTLDGMRPVDPEVPVCHVSYYEADAFARWRKARLPLETEWEAAAGESPLDGNLFEAGALHPIALATTPSASTLAQLFGDVWEWTSSPYVAYPGYAPPPGALGEYNGKFMCNQMVLRGASCVTPRRHVRRTYRNFFPPETRWQFSGIRLAR